MKSVVLLELYEQQQDSGILIEYREGRFSTRQEGKGSGEC